MEMLYLMPKSIAGATSGLWLADNISPPKGPCSCGIKSARLPGRQNIRPGRQNAAEQPLPLPLRIAVWK